ncbi:hypothetical protein [Crateriforma spongiae]|uniref:hypothetical protein n=1 Tax=Crateriforma spongiae TaxID=2724528 RepID=UPI00144748FB|nr:hypothetical protein [Crateriforma spongiae]
MNTKLSNDQRDQLRREAGLLTTDEAAAVLGCEPIDVARQYWLGTFTENTNAKGEPLIALADVSRYTARGCPGLNDTPRVDGGWFDLRPAISQVEFFQAMKKDPMAFNRSDHRGPLGVLYLAGEAHRFARRFVDRLPMSAMSTKSGAMKFYLAGPRAFAKFKSEFHNEMMGTDHGATSRPSAFLAAMGDSSKAKRSSRVRIAGEKSLANSPLSVITASDRVDFGPGLIGEALRKAF